MLELWRVTEVVSHSDTHHTVSLHTGELKGLIAEQKIKNTLLTL